MLCSMVASIHSTPGLKPICAQSICDSIESNRGEPRFEALKIPDLEEGDEDDGFGSSAVYGNPSAIDLRLDLVLLNLASSVPEFCQMSSFWSTLFRRWGAFEYRR